MPPPLVTEEPKRKHATVRFKQDDETTATTTKNRRDSMDTSKTFPEMSSRKLKQKQKSESKLTRPFLTRKQSTRNIRRRWTWRKKCLREKSQMNDDQCGCLKSPITNLQIAPKETRKARRMTRINKEKSKKQAARELVDSDSTRGK